IVASNSMTCQTINNRLSQIVDYMTTRIRSKNFCLKTRISKIDFYSQIVYLILQLSTVRGRNHKMNFCSKLQRQQEAVSILVWDQDDPLTVKNAAEAIEEYQSVVIPCSSAEAVLFTIQHNTVDVVIF